MKSDPGLVEGVRATAGWVGHKQEERYSILLRQGQERGCELGSWKRFHLSRWSRFQGQRTSGFGHPASMHLLLVTKPWFLLGNHLFLFSTLWFWSGAHDRSFYSVTDMGRTVILQGTCYHIILLILSSEDCEMKARWLPEVPFDSCYFSDPEPCNFPSDNSLISWSFSILCLHLVLSPNVHLSKPKCYMTSLLF